MPYVKMPEGPLEIDPFSEWAWGLVFCAYSRAGSGLEPLTELTRRVKSSAPTALTNSPQILGTGKTAWAFTASETNQVQLTSNASFCAWFESPATSTGAGY